MAGRDIVIGLDIGTTTTIGLAARMPGEVIAVASRPVELVSRHPGWAEQDPQQWWDNAIAILRELTEQVDAKAIAGVCVTGMLPAVVLLDEDDRVLRPSIQQSDGRSGREVEELQAVFN